MSVYQRLFSRFELKYVMETEVANDFVARIVDNLDVDPHADDTGAYRVSSVYYDSPTYDCYWEKIDGLKDRRKVRVRRYLDADHELASLEIKQRIDRTIQKRRNMLPLEQVYSVVPPPDSWNRPTVEVEAETDLVKEVRGLVAHYDLIPQVMINYRRKAFQAKYDNGLRITIDSQLKCRQHNLDWADLADDDGVYFVPPGYVILEVKFNEVVPRWLTNHIAQFQCDLRRVSKYCEGIQLLVFDRDQEASDRTPAKIHSGVVNG